MRRALVTPISMLAIVLLLLVPATALAEVDPAPHLVASGLPSVTTHQEVWVNVTPADLPLGGACYEMRVANEDGVWGNWGFCKKTAHNLSNGYGIKGVFVQGRNASGVKGNIIFTKIQYVSPANFKGWANVGGHEDRAAWLWTTAGWKAVTLPAGARVYAWPFSGVWQWAWHAEQWHAIRTSELALP